MEPDQLKEDKDEDKEPTSKSEPGLSATKTTTANVLYSRHGADEEESAYEVVPTVKKRSSTDNKQRASFSHSGVEGGVDNLVARRTAVELFKSKNVITDAEFEEILDLCDVRLSIPSHANRVRSKLVLILSYSCILYRTKLSSKPSEMRLKRKRIVKSTCIMRMRGDKCCTIL
jgi:hypothetical protein